MSYVSDRGGTPNWDQYVHGYGRGNVLQGAGASTWYKGSDLYTGNLLTGDAIPEEWRLDPKHDYHTKWHISDAQGYTGGGLTWEGAPNSNQTGGAGWGYKRQRGNAPRSISHWGQWYEDAGPGHRANLTTGKAALALTRKPGGSSTEARGGRRYSSGRFAGREVVDWETYDRKGKDWLAETGRGKFRTRKDLYDYHEWKELGAAGRAQKEALEELEKWKAAALAKEELRKAQEPKKIDITQDPRYQQLMQQSSQMQLARQQDALKYQQLQSQFGGLQDQLGGLQNQYSQLGGRFSGLQGQYSGLQGQYSGLQGQFGSLQGQYSGLQGQYGNLKGEYKSYQDAMAASEQRRRMQSQFGWGGQGAGGIKHAMFMRQPEDGAWSPHSALGREGERITTGGINV